MFSNEKGSFKNFEATLLFDGEDMSKASVSFKIDAASIDTDNPDRDKHLRSADFFDVEKFPHITFKDSSWNRTGNKYELTGHLDMRGFRKEVVVPVEFYGIVKDPKGNESAGFGFGFTMNRKDYGINWNKSLDQGGVLLGDDVKIDCNLEFTKQKV